MSESKHWLDETSEADDFERAVLRAGLEADPPQAKQEQVWSGLMATLALAPLAAATTSAQATAAQATVIGVSKAGVVGLAVTKGFIVGLAIYGAAAGVTGISNRIGARHALAPTAQQAIAPVRSPPSAPQHSPASSAPLLTPTSEAAPSSTAYEPRPSNASAKGSTSGPARPAPTLPSVATFDDVSDYAEHPTDARISQLEAETRALRRAHDELRAGKLADAFATLDTSRRQFSAPELYQEREALMLELLFLSGQTAAAKQRARAFLSRFPESPHAQQIRRLTEH
jgi:hypothetical protein